jgi:hypothetical protein
MSPGVPPAGGTPGDKESIPLFPGEEGLGVMGKGYHVPCRIISNGWAQDPALHFSTSPPVPGSCHLKVDVGE